MRHYKFIFLSILMLFFGASLHAERSKKIVLEVKPPLLHPLQALPGVDYFLLGTAKQIFERSPHAGRQSKGDPIVVLNLLPDSVVTVESSAGEELRRVLFVNGQNELRIADLDGGQKYSLIVKHPNKAQPFKIENVETGSQIRILSEGNRR